MNLFFPACFEVALQSFFGRNRRTPSESCLQLLICVASLLPERVPSAAVECWWQLAFRPGAVSLPKITEKIAGRLRDVERPESPHAALIKAQEVPARRQIIVDYIKCLTINSGRDGSEHNCIGTIIHVRKRNRIRTAKVQKYSEGANSDAPA